MIRETTIDAEQRGSDEAHDLKLPNVLMRCIEEAIEEGNLFDHDNDDCVCLYDPTDIEAAIAVVMPEARSAMANVALTDTTGGSILENLSIAKPLVIKLKYFQQLKNDSKAMSYTQVHLKRYYSIYRIYAAILSGSQKSNRFLTII